MGHAGFLKYNAIGHKWPMLKDKYIRYRLYTGKEKDKSQKRSNLHEYNEITECNHLRCSLQE